MTIGGSIALIIIGGILAFAVTWTSPYVDFRAMGVIIMLGGIVLLGFSVGFRVARRRSQGRAQVIEERRYIEPPR